MDQDPPARLIAVPEVLTASTRSLVIARLPAPPASFVGREQELADLCALLARDDVRLLTLTGPGGVGKTRLAIRAAEEIAAAFADGIAFVEFAGVREPELALPAVYQALGGREVGSDVGAEQFHALLGDRELLLVLDNFEHLVAAATNVTDLLAAFPRLKILVTSRSALRLSAEHEYLAPPLGLTEDGSHAADEASWSDALRLFVQRARAARRDLELTQEALAAAGEICRRLDGLPLAIELAAARTDHLSPQAILGRLDSPGAGWLPMLTGGLRDQPARQQTMRDAIAWSFDLLDARERELFQQLAVFVDGFSVDAAENVSLSPFPPFPLSPSTLDTLGSLVAKSLLRYAGDYDGEPHYRLFETIREFGLEQLATSGKEAVVRQRHAEWGLAFAASAARSSAVPFDLLEREHANLRAALAWFHEQTQGESLLRLSAALCSFWEEHAHFVEGRHWLEAAIAQSEEIRTAERLAVLTSAGTMAWLHNDFRHAIVRHNQALTLARALGDREAEAFALNNLAAQAMELDEFDEACRQFEACMEIARETGALEVMMLALHNLGQLRRMRFDSVTAMMHMEEAYTLAREMETEWIPNVLNGLGMGTLDLGDPVRSDEILREALAAGRERGILSDVVDSLEGLARVRATVGDAASAARLFAAAEVQREWLSTPLSALEHAYFGRSVQRSRVSLGPADFAAAWAEGRALSIDDAVALALASSPAPRKRPSEEGLALPSGKRLTEREREVLRLIAGGLNNREMAQRLRISPGTIARHIANIYKKLSVDSRAEATVFAHRLGLL